MLKKLTISSLLLCSSNVLMAEDVTPAQVEASDSTTKMESMQIRATAAEQPAVPANVPNTIEGVTAKQISESINAVTTPQVLQYLPSVHVRERYIGVLIVFWSCASIALFPAHRLRYMPMIYYFLIF